MDNHVGNSGRKRGLTKHSVEDQALDQIAKEKFVGLGVEKTSTEEEPIENSSPEDTSSNNNYKEAKDVVVNSSDVTKKRHKSKKKKKQKKEKETEILPDSENTANPDQLIDVIDFEPNSKDDLSYKSIHNFSHSDACNTEESTSQDVSMSNMADDSGGSESTHYRTNESGMEEILTNEVDEEIGKAEVDFDEFWAEFDAEEGRLRRESRSDVVITSEEAVNSANDNENSFSSKKEVLQSDRSSLQNSTAEGNDNSANDNEYSVSSNKEVLQSDRSSHQNSTADGNDDLENFWDDREYDFCPRSEREKALSSKLMDEKNKNAILKDQGNENLNDIDDFWADLNEDSTVLRSKPVTESPLESAKENEEVEERSGDDDEGYHDVNFAMAAKNVGNEFEGANAAQDEKNEDLSNDESCPVGLQEGEEEETKTGAEAVSSDQQTFDEFWGETEDPLPPVFQIKKNLDDLPEGAVAPPLEEALVADSHEIGQVKTCEEINDSIGNNDLCKDDHPQKSGSEESGTTEDENETDGSMKVPSEEGGDVNSGQTGSSEQITETPEVLPADHSVDESKESDAVKDVKEAHRHNFASALRDIEAPARRRSVLLPDSRERVLRQERPLTPESSADGEASEDDGIMDFLGKENDRAEQRLAARRQARVEAREIRMRELERVQKEQQEEGGDRLFDAHVTPRSSTVSPRERPTSINSYHSSRRSSEDSMEDGLNLRDIRHELKEVEEKFRKAMIANAQLDNEKASSSYQVELLKDKLEDLEEAHSQLGREHRERCREHEALKRSTLKLKEDLNVCRQCLEERDMLIADYGLVIVGGEVDEKGELMPRSLVSKESAEILGSLAEGSLDVRLKTFAKEKDELLDELRHLKLELEEERNRRRNDKILSNGPIGDEIQQTLNDYRFRLQKSDQETSTLQATVARLESQVIRYKTAAETSEKAEDELKIEKRKLQRENRESIARIEELETANSHLQRRMDKLKNAKSTLLKEL